MHLPDNIEMRGAMKSYCLLFLCFLLSACSSEPAGKRDLRVWDKPDIIQERDECRAEQAERAREEQERYRRDSVTALSHQFGLDW